MSFSDSPFCAVRIASFRVKYLAISGVTGEAVSSSSSYVGT